MKPVALSRLWLYFYLDKARLALVLGWRVHSVSKAAGRGDLLLTVS